MLYLVREILKTVFTCTFINFCCPFKQQCQRKREKSFSEYAVQQKTIKINLEAVNYLKQEREFLSNIRKELQERVHRFSRAQKYLLAVKNSSEGEFSSVRDIIEGFKQLETERKNTFDHIDEIITETQNRKQLLSNLEEVFRKIINYN